MYGNKYVALYLRLSLEDKNKNSNSDDSNSIRSQKMLLEKYVEACPDFQNYSIKTYTDDGYSGTNFDRPQFQRLLEDIKNKKIYCIIVKDLSRFGRSYIEVGEYLEHIFPLLGIRFISVNDGYDSDKLIGTTGGIEVAFKNLIHQKYSQDASEKIKAAMHLKMSKGEYVTHCPFGYTKEKGVKHQMVVDPATAPIVKKIFQLAIEGVSSVQIAKRLNEENAITPSQRKNTAAKIKSDVIWSHQAVIRIIKDYKYTGAMVNFKCENETIRAKTQKHISPDEWVVVENMHEPIISHEEYELANSNLRKVTPHQKTKHSDLNIEYYCGYCGRKLRTTYGNDVYYSCVAALYKNSSPCSKIRLVRSEIEGIILEIFKKYIRLGLQHLEERKKIEKAFDKGALSDKRQEIQDSIEKEKNKNLELYECYRDNGLTVDEYFERKAEIVVKINEQKKKLALLDEEIAETDKKQKSILAQEQVFNDYAEISKDNEKLMEKMRMSIDRVIVWGNDNIKICWKNKDMFKERLF